MGGRLGSRFTGLGIATLAGLGAWLAFSGVSDDGETLLTPIHREVASATTVSQGDRFYADDDDGDPKTKQSCTIGYIFPGTTVAEVAAGTGAFIDNIKERAITLRTDNGIAAALDRLTLRNVGDLGQMMDRKKSPGSIAHVEAPALALTGLTLSLDTAPPPTIWT